MGKSLKRRCKACKTELQGNFNNHLRYCQGKFIGWIYYNKAGMQVQDTALPKRPSRVVDGKRGVKIKKAIVRVTPANAWTKLKRRAISELSTETVYEGIGHIVNKALQDERVKPNEIFLAMEAAMKKHGIKRVDKGTGAIFGHGGN